MIVVIDFEEVANQWGEEWLWFGRRRGRDRREVQLHMSNLLT